MNEKKILFIMNFKDKAEERRERELLKNTPLLLPQGWSFEFCDEIITKKTAAAYNKIIRKSDAKYKVYLHTPLNQMQQNIFIEMLNAFLFDTKAGIVGLIGSELPIDGNYTKAKKFYGEYHFINEKGEPQNYFGKQPLFFQETHIVDGSFFLTGENIEWDESADEDFLVASYCCRFRAKGYKVGVIYHEKPLATFAKDEFDYTSNKNEKGREKFFAKYKNIVAPLVSICIPTYNQPEFFRQALESAINQTYPNIEIVVGDDSTDTRTKNLIQPYLKKYKKIKYFFHA